jgi:hypothetical protein
MSAQEIERVLLTDKEAAFFTGLSLWTLRSARSNNPTSRMFLRTFG